MDTPLGEMQFRYPWRSYQARVLEELSNFLRDDHLHIVAAPGSGKTVLGLEVMHRLDRPTLILAPTLTIRNQWIDRLIHLFLPEGAGRPDWITTDIRQPRLVTVATYQALRRKKGGTAVAQMNDGICEGCGVAVSQSLEWKLRQGELVTCGNCERIIVRL